MKHKDYYTMVVKGWEIIPNTYIEKIEKIQGEAEENIDIIEGDAEEKIEKIKSDAEEKILDAEKKVAEAESKCEREIRDVREKDKKLRTHIEDIGAKVLGTFKTDQFKKRKDWERGAMGQDDYKAYVRGHIYADNRVFLKRHFEKK